MYSLILMASVSAGPDVAARPHLFARGGCSGSVATARAGCQGSVARVAAVRTGCGGSFAAVAPIVRPIQLPPQAPIPLPMAGPAVTTTTVTTRTTLAAPVVPARADFFLDRRPRGLFGARATAAFWR
jgi:hypothetical protein